MAFQMQRRLDKNLLDWHCLSTNVSFSDSCKTNDVRAFKKWNPSSFECLFSKTLIKPLSRTLLFYLDGFLNLIMLRISEYTDEFVTKAKSTENVLQYYRKLTKIYIANKCF